MAPKCDCMSELKLWKKNFQLNLCLIFLFLIKYYLKIRSSRRLLGVQKWDRNDLDQFIKLMFISHEVGNFVSTMTNSQNILKLDKKILPKIFHRSGMTFIGVFKIREKFFVWFENAEVGTKSNFFLIKRTLWLKNSQESATFLLTRSLKFIRNFLTVNYDLTFNFIDFFRWKFSWKIILIIILLKICPERTSWN